MLWRDLTTIIKEKVINPTFFCAKKFTVLSSEKFLLAREVDDS